jgi:hypothetical protein
MLGAVLVSVALVLVLVELLTDKVGRTFRKYRGHRLVTCPETRAPAAVKAAAGRAAFDALFDLPRLRLKTCSRWPERQDCDQPCVWQIRACPSDTAVSTIIRRWYTGKRCVACDKPLDGREWYEHKPGALGPESDTVEWRDVAPERIPTLMQTHLPLCWNCLVVQTFCRRYPELIVERPAKTSKEQ